MRPARSRLYVAGLFAMGKGLAASDDSVREQTWPHTARSEFHADDKST